MRQQGSRAEKHPHQERKGRRGRGGSEGGGKERGKEARMEGREKGKERQEGREEGRAENEPPGYTCTTLLATSAPSLLLRFQIFFAQHQQSAYQLAAGSDCLELEVFHHLRHFRLILILLNLQSLCIRLGLHNNADICVLLLHVSPLDPCLCLD